MKKTLAALVAVTALLAACSSDDDEPKASSTTEAPSETPKRIVSLSATATEMLFAIDAGDQVVAVDDYSNYPDDAPTTDLSALEPNIEAITTYEPDLVVVANPGEVVDGLEEVGIEVLVAPAAETLDDTYDQLTELGEVTGHEDEAAEVVSSIKGDIAELVAQVPERPEGAPPLTYFHELDNTLYSVTSKTFIGELYGLAGLENIADAADPDGANGGYPQVSTELLVQANPDLVFLADTKCCDQDAASFGARPGFATLKAVATGHVIPLDDDIASRWGPRVVELLRTIIDAVKALPST